MNTLEKYSKEWSARRNSIAAVRLKDHALTPQGRDSTKYYIRLATLVPPAQRPLSERMVCRSLLLPHLSLANFLLLPTESDPVGVRSTTTTFGSLHRPLSVLLYEQLPYDLNSH